MTVTEMIGQLSQFPPNLEVKITDGFRCQFYAGDFEINLFEERDGVQIVDIGIGGYDEDDDD